MNRDQEDAILAQAKEIERKRMAEYVAKAEAVQARVAGAGDPFTDSELVYAASSRCRCGAGFAYPAGVGGNGSWYCSAVLKDKALRGQPAQDHDEAMPFAFWSVRSESQIARNGGIVTTRPEGAPWGASMELSVQRENERRAQWQPELSPMDLATEPVKRPGATRTETA